MCEHYNNNGNIKFEIKGNDGFIKMQNLKCNSFKLKQVLIDTSYFIKLWEPICIHNKVSCKIFRFFVSFIEKCVHLKSCHYSQLIVKT